MRKALLFAVIAIFILSSCQKQKDATAVKLTFESYKNAVKNNKDSVLFLIDNESIDALIEFENLIKSRSNNMINSFIRKQEAPLTWTYLFQTLSSIGSKGYELDTLNPRFTLTLFSLAGIHIFNSEGINDFDYIGIEEKKEDEYIVKIAVKNHFATEANSVSIIKKIPFRKENGNWKINAISYFTLYEKVLIYKAREMNMNPEEYIQYIYQQSKQE